MLLIFTLAFSTLLAPIKTLTILLPLQSPATLVQSSGSPLGVFNVATPVPANVSATLGDISTATNVSISGNISNTANESASGTLLSVDCDGNRYGSKLNIQSCKNLFRYVGKTSEQTTFANRHTGIEAKIELPWRIYDNKSLCFVQPFLRQGKQSAQASSEQVGNAAYTLMHECVIKRGVGGIAANIGGDNNLLVAIAKYQPKIKCNRKATPGLPWSSCRHIWGTMETGQEMLVFGDKEDPDVQVDLPYVLKAIDARCELEIAITGESALATWYEIWEATTALSASCVRTYGVGGRFTGLGSKGNIYLDMYDGAPDLTANTTQGNPSAVILGEPPGKYSAYNYSSLNNWTELDVQNFTFPDLGNFVQDPFVFSNTLEEGNSTLVTLPGDLPMNTSQDATE